VPGSVATPIARAIGRAASPILPAQRRMAARAIRIVPAEAHKEGEAEFLMIKDGLICFEGDANALRHSQDAYLKTFLS